MEKTVEETGDKHCTDLFPVRLFHTARHKVR